MTDNSELWWRPTALEFQEVHVRGKTDWTTILFSDLDGVFGQGEITSTQLESGVASVTARLANRLRGERITSDEDVLRIISIPAERLEHDQLTATAVSALRCAVADALAKRAGMSLSQYLRHTNGEDAGVDSAAHSHGLYSVGRARVDSDCVALYANINRSLLPDDRGPLDRAPENFAEMAAEAVKNGFTTIKCAPFDECQSPFDGSGLPPCAESGLQRVQAVRDAVGPDVTVLVDCHSRFDLDSALALEPELRAAGGEWFEEPVDPIVQPQDLREIREHASLPIAGAEHGYGTALFSRLVREDVLDIVMPDIKFCGGPVEAYRIGAELESLRAGTVSMHCPSGPLSLLASAHATLAFRRPGTLPLEHAVYEADWRHTVLEPYEQIENGEIRIPEGFGLAARIDPAILAVRGKTWQE